MRIAMLQWPSAAGIILLLSALFMMATSTAASNFCTRGQDCWPTTKELSDLYKAMNPMLKRSLYWNSSAGQPLTDPIPVFFGIDIPEAKQNQPLLGAGANLEPLYVQSDAERNSTCFAGGTYFPTFCEITVRNEPLHGWSPAFVAFPLNVAQVQLAVNFAFKHRLQVCVTATGHDLLNRHSCNQVCIQNMNRTPRQTPCIYQYLLDCMDAR